MKITTTYSKQIRETAYRSVFRDTVAIYRRSVDFLTDVCLENWDVVSCITGGKKPQVNYVEKLVHNTEDNKASYDFDTVFYKYPSYLRRAAISEAIGKTASYKSNLLNWEKQEPQKRGKMPGIPKAGFVYPCLYRGNMYKADGEYGAMIKVRIHNTWDWITLSLRKSDCRYISRYCGHRTECTPTLMKRGKLWYLDFPYEEEKELTDTDILGQTAVSVDLGLNSPATISVMHADGSITGRHTLSLSKLQDQLEHAINRIKKAQQNGAKRMPRLWAAAKGINERIAVLTAQFIMKTAELYNADVIVFEHLDTGGKKHGSKKQKLHHWRAKYVQKMVGVKAHRAGMHVSHICAWGTSRLAYDGSGRVLRGKEADLKSYSICRFTTGKIYNCDLNASYNIGARYFIREIIKSCRATVRLQLGAKVPQACKRSTCTLSVLINLFAELEGLKPASI